MFWNSKQKYTVSMINKQMFGDVFEVLKTWIFFKVFNKVRLFSRSFRNVNEDPCKSSLVLQKNAI